MKLLNVLQVFSPGAGIRRLSLALGETRRFIKASGSEEAKRAYAERVLGRWAEKRGAVIPAIALTYTDRLNSPLVEVLYKLETASGAQGSQSHKALRQKNGHWGNP